jgi:hypothetical protein
VRMRQTNDYPNELSVVSGVRNKLEAWLNKTKWTQAKLLDWLMGYELPAIGHTEEPYVWLLRALANSDETHRERMAGRLAAFLDAEAPYQRTEKYDDEFLYNLFYLCSGLQQPAALSQPLYRAAHFFEHHQDKRLLLSNNNRYNLIGALRDALIANQTNDQFKSVWQSMVEGQTDHFLQGNPYVGFEGLLFMRGSTAAADTPPSEQIGWALRKMAEHIENDSNRRTIFDRLLSRVHQAWPNYRRWDEDMLSMAINYRWPRWAALRLNSLVVPLDITPEGRGRYLIWEFYKPYLTGSEASSTSVKDGYLDDLIFDVQLDPEKSTLLNAVYHCVEFARVKCPTENYKAIRKVADEALKNLREQWLGLKKQWTAADEKDSVFYRFLYDGRIENLVASQPADKQEDVRESLKASAAGGGR